ncbi:DUF3987 domain-containing protein [uncultured Salegentibacter sp.]|uniref:DUF3987 domain-containing protein n=1 Tax=uncultured Salegentibacter sp. TaxID=259320 RepID=UPI0030D7FC96
MTFKDNIEGIYEFTFGEELECKLSNTKFEQVKLPEGENHQVEFFPHEEQTVKQNEWLERHYINKSVMKANKVFFLKSYTFIANSGKTLKINSEDDLVLGIKMFNGWKIYKPNASEYKVIYIGEKDKEYFFGYACFKNSVEKLKSFGYITKRRIFLCAGEKDTMILQSMGLEAFCLASETATFIPKNLYKIWKELDEFSDLEIVLVYDNDKTGIKQAERMVERQKQYGHNIWRFEWPDSIFKDGGKDVADCITSGYPVEELHKLLTGGDLHLYPFSPVSPISPQAVHSNFKGENEYENEEREGRKLGSFEECKNEYSQDQVEKDPDHSSDFPLPASLKREDLPETLQKLIHPFDKEYFEMLIISFVTIFGAVFRNVVGRFRNDKLYTNLFTAIIGNPASGKGLIKWPNRLVKDIDQMLIRESRLNMDEYEQRLELYNRGEIKYQEVGPKPKLETFSIPADITPSMLVLQLFENKGTGFVFDTEMDTMVESAKGSDTTISPLLRKAYEGEPITLMRKTNREHLIVPEGRLSMLQSGTPRQFFRLIPDTENGLFSRVIPYILHSELGWKNALDIDDFDYEGYFANHAQKVLDYFIELESYEDPIVFELSKQQLEKFDRHFRERFEQAKNIAGLDVRATVIRLGAITVKIAIILSTLRKLDSQEQFNNSTLVCDIDLASALSISDIILNNVMDTLKMMKNRQIEDCFRGKKLEYFYELDDEFTFSDSQKLAEESGIKIRTAQKWIYQFRDQGFLLNPTKGQFKKII